MTYVVNTSTCPKNCNEFLVSSPCELASLKACTGSSTPPSVAYQVLHPANNCDALSGGLSEGYVLSVALPTLRGCIARIAAFALVDFVLRLLIIR